MSLWPESLAEVARRTQAGERDFDLCWREFLDAFYADQYAGQRADMLAEQPEPLAGSLADVREAFLSGLAAHLAQSYGLPVPDWCETYGRALKRPRFAGGME